MPRPEAVITVGLNPAIDRVIEVPGLAIGQHVTGRSVWRRPAGKAVNVSRALALLGRDSVTVGFVGAGEKATFEQFLQRPTWAALNLGQLRRARGRRDGLGRISCRFVPVKGQTRENITLVDPFGHVDLHIREEGFQVGRSDLRRLGAELAGLCGARAVTVFTGSLPPGADAAELLRLIRTAGQTGSPIALDLSGTLLREVLKSGVDKLALVKPNQQELAVAMGRSELKSHSQILAAARGLARYVEWVVVSLGQEGALLVGRQGAWHGWLAPELRRVLSTVGCGDCMLAGLLDAYLRRESPAAMLRRGLAAAVANMYQAGPADFDLAEIPVLSRKAKIVAV